MYRIVSQIFVHVKHLLSGSLVFITNTYSIWYFIQFVPIAIFMSLHGPAGACILVGSGLQFMYLQYNLYAHICDLTCEKGSYALLQVYKNIHDPPVQTNYKTEFQLAITFQWSKQFLM